MKYKIIKGLFLILISILLNGCERSSDISLLNKIIFARDSGEEKEKMEIWLTDSKGRNQSRVIKKEGDPLISGPVWSPDGKKIAFTHCKSNDQDIESWLKRMASGQYGPIFSRICIIDYHTKKEMILTDDSLKSWKPCWSPDGKQLVFSAGKNILDSDIYIIEINSKKVKKMASTPNRDINPIWSPDGKNIAFITCPVQDNLPDVNSDIYIINVETNNLIKLTDNPYSDGDFSWSPDGRKIAYSSWRYSHKIGEIFVIDIETKNEIRLTDTDDNKYMSQWSPDSKKIAFVSDEMLYLMDADGKNREKLTDKTQCYVSYGWRLNWSPDSKKIVFVGIPPHLVQKKICWGDIYTIDIESKELKNLTNTPDLQEGCPSWRPVIK